MESGGFQPLCYGSFGAVVYEKKRAAVAGSSLEECMKFIKVGCGYFLSIFLPLTM